MIHFNTAARKGTIKVKENEKSVILDAKAKYTNDGKFVVLSLGSCAMFWFSVKAVRNLG